jgi:hypothetical protein
MFLWLLLAESCGICNFIEILVCVLLLIGLVLIKSLMRIAGCLECIICYNCVQHLTFRVYWLAICSFSDCSYTVPDDEFNELETCRTLNINIMLY